MLRSASLQPIRGVDESEDRDFSRIAHDPLALESFYRRHVRALIRFAARRSSSPEEVADLVAGVFVEAIASADSFDPRRGDPLYWLFGIATRLAANRRRQGAREAAAFRRISGRRLLEPDDYQRLEEQIDAGRLAPQLEQAIRALPPAERMLVELLIHEECSLEEAARVLGVRSAAVRMRLTRARRRMRRSLAADDLEASASSAMNDVGVDS